MLQIGHALRYYNRYYNEKVKTQYTDFQEFLEPKVNHGRRIVWIMAHIANQGPQFFLVAYVVQFRVAKIPVNIER